MDSIPGISKLLPFAREVARLTKFVSGVVLRPEASVLFEILIYPRANSSGAISVRFGQARKGERGYQISVAPNTFNSVWFHTRIWGTSFSCMAEGVWEGYMPRMVVTV